MGEVVRLRFVATLLLTLSVTATVAASVVLDDPGTGSAIWAEMLTAKGGRERLRTVDNVQRSISIRRGAFGRSPLCEEALFVLPDALWQWEDWRPTNIGLQLRVIDQAANRMRLVREGSDRVISSTPNLLEAEWSRDFQLAMLLETRWVTPRPMGVRDVRMGFRRILVLEAELGPDRIDYYLRSDRLPFRVVLRPGDARERVFELDDYLPVDGIQLPTKVKVRNGLLVETFTARYRIDVDFDPAIFDEAPSLARGPAGWQRSAVPRNSTVPRNCQPTHL